MRFGIVGSVVMYRWVHTRLLKLGTQQPCLNEMIALPKGLLPSIVCDFYAWHGADRIAASGNRLFVDSGLKGCQLSAADKHMLLYVHSKRIF